MLNRKKVYKVELKKRLGNPDNLVNGLIWESDWTDITDYFIERKTSIATSLDDATLQGKLEQSSTIIQLNNVSGKFNPSGTENSLWENDGYLYHSRIRLWEYFEEEDAEDTGLLPLLDGLIAEEPKYRAGMLVDITVNSKLDILREHYILENIIGRVKRAEAQSIITYIIELFNTTYAELGVTTTGGILRERVIYDDITPFSDDLLSLMNQFISYGGSIGGLTRDDKLLFTYYGATTILRKNLEDTASCIGLWLCDDADYSDGAGTTIADKSSSAKELTVVSDLVNKAAVGQPIPTLVDTWSTGLFDWSVSNFYRVAPVAPTDYLVNIVCKLTNNSSTGNSLDLVWPSSSTAQHIINPVFMWSTKTSSDLSILNIDGTSGDLAYCEGFSIDYKGELEYIKAHNPVVPLVPFTSDIYPMNSTVIDYRKGLISLLGERLIQYIAIHVSETNDEITVYLNGKRINVFPIPTGIIGSITKSKLVGSFFCEVYGAFLFEIQKGYFSSIQIIDGTPANLDSEILATYKKLFGVTGL